MVTHEMFREWKYVSEQSTRRFLNEGSGDYKAMINQLHQRSAEQGFDVAYI